MTKRSGEMANFTKLFKGSIMNHHGRPAFLTGGALGMKIFPEQPNGQVSPTAGLISPIF